MPRNTVGAATICLLSAIVPAAAQPTADRLEVRRVTLHGVTAVDEEQLRSVLDTRPSSWLPWRAPHYFDPETLERDLERLVAFYHDHGYPHARVLAHEVDVDEGAQAVDITIHVEEGAPLRVGEVALSGFDRLPDRAVDELRARMPLAVGAPIVRREVTAAGELAVRALQDRGYPSAEVRVFEQPIEGDRVRVRYHAEPGAIAFFGRVEIAGNAQVEDHVIRRELQYKPGELFRRSRIEESQRRIAALDLFESVDIEAVRAPSRPSEIVSQVKVKEGKMQRTSYAVGYGTEEQALGELRWQHLNFLGAGRSLALRGQWSSIERGVAADFAQPYFFSPRLILALDGRYWHTNEPVFDSRARGGRAALVTRISEQTSAALSVASEHQRTRIADAALEDPSLQDRLVALGLDPASGEQAGLLTTVGLELRRSTATDRRDPRDGTLLSLRLDRAGGWLGGSYHFLDLVGEARLYRPLGDRAAAAGRLRIGAIDPSGLPSDIPFRRRYFLGGATSLRGWGRYEVSPLSESGLPIGGQSLLAMTAELRFQVIGDAGGALFVDAGQVWDDAWSYALDDLLADVGAGIRYDSPLGLLRLDVGYQLTPVEELRIDGEPQSRRWRVHFGLGQVF